MKAKKRRRRKAFNWESCFQSDEMQGSNLTGVQAASHHLRLFDEEQWEIWKRSDKKQGTLREMCSIRQEAGKGSDRCSANIISDHWPLSSWSEQADSRETKNMRRVKNTVSPLNSLWNKLIISKMRKLTNWQDDNWRMTRGQDEKMTRW